MELLAPCGSIEALKRAVSAGADAVYFGLGELNARAKAIEFNLDNLPQWVDYCHLFGVKVYITLNVEIYHNELDRALELVKGAYNAKVDALIVSDLGLILAIRKDFPDFPIHVSTQAGVKDINGALFYKKLGVKRVVLARECGFKEYEEISKVIEVEVFVHGALCVSFSGACLMSSYIGGNSGNRGRCKQPCRQEYIAREENGKPLKKGYLLSPKDINLCRHLDRISLCGVASLKIEGRLKSPEYVYAVTSYYRARLNGEVIDASNVLKTFNRGGFCEGYLNNNDVIYTKVANHIGVKIGKVLKVQNRKGFSFAEIDSEVFKGDGLKILRKGIEVGGSDVTSVTKTANGYLIPVSKEVKPDDEVRITRDKRYCDFCNKQNRHLGVNFKLTFSNNKATLVAYCGDFQAMAECDLEVALRTLSRQEIENQLSKLGDTNFIFEGLQLYGEGYLPKSKLNSLRKNAVDLLERELITSYSPLREMTIIPQNEEFTSKVKGLIIEISSPNLFGLKPSAVVYTPQLLDDKVFDIISDLKQCVENVYLRLPLLLSSDKQLYFAKKGVDTGFGLYADNVGLIELCRKLNLPYIVGTTLNISNTLSSRLLYDADAIIYTHEVGISPIEEGHTYQSGRLALMHFYHCPNQVVSGNRCSTCKSKGRTLYYESEGRSFPVKAVISDRCYYTLYADKQISVKTNNKNIFKSLCD